MTELCSLKPLTGVHSGEGDLKGNLGDCSSHLLLCLHTQYALAHTDDARFVPLPSFSHTHTHKQTCLDTGDKELKGGGGGDWMKYVWVHICVGFFLFFLGGGHSHRMGSHTPCRATYTLVNHQSQQKLHREVFRGV